MSVNMDTLINLQDDQLQDLYAVQFPNGIPGTSGFDTQILTLRQDQTFPWPTEEIGTYDIMYQGLKVTKEGNMDSTDKKITIAFRLDTAQKVYNALRSWKNICLDTFFGTGDTEVNTRTNMVVQLLGPNKQIVRTGTFHGCKIYSLHPTDNDHASTEPQRIEVGFIFYYFRDG